MSALFVVRRNARRETAFLSGAPGRAARCLLAAALFGGLVFVSADVRAADIDAHVVFSGATPFGQFPAAALVRLGSSLSPSTVGPSSFINSAVLKPTLPFMSAIAGRASQTPGLFQWLGRFDGLTIETTGAAGNSGGGSALADVFGNLLARANIGRDVSGTVAGAQYSLDDAQVGGFAGRVQGASAAVSDQAVQGDAYFAGLYAGGDLGLFDVAAILTAGYIDYGQVPVSGDVFVPIGFGSGFGNILDVPFSGAFVEFELGASGEIPLRDGFSLVPGARAQYSGLFEEARPRSKNGGGDGFGHPDLHLLTGRTQLALAFAPALPVGGPQAHAAIWVALEGRANLSSGSGDAMLLGQRITLDTGGRAFGSALAGGGLFVDTGVEGMSFSLIAEGGPNVGGSDPTTVNAALRLRYEF